MKVLRRIRQLLIAVVVTVVLLVGAVLIALRTDWGRQRLAIWLAGAADPYVDGELSIGRLEGGLWSDATLHEVIIRRQGIVVLRADQVRASFNILGFFGSDIRIHTLTLVKPDLVAIEHAGGWYVDGLELPDKDPASPPSTTTITMPDIEVVDGHAEVRQLSRRYDLVDLDADLSVVVARDITIDVERLSTTDAAANLPIRSLKTVILINNEGTTLDPFVATTPHSAVQGRIRWATGSRLIAQLRSDGFALREFVSYVPSVKGLDLRPALELTLDGPLSALHVVGPIRDPQAGDFAVDLVANVAGAFAARGRATLVDVDASRLRPVPMETTRLTGDVRFDVRASEAGQTVGTFGATLSRAIYGQYDVSQVRAEGTLTDAGGRAQYSAVAYGAPTQGTAGWSTTSSVITADGHIERLDMRRLPAFLDLPALATTLQGDYRVRLDGPRWRLATTLDESTVEGGVVAAETTAEVTSDGTRITYDVNGRVRALDVKRVTSIVLDAPVEWPVERVSLTGPLVVKGAGPIATPMAHDLTFSGRLDVDVDGAVVQQADVVGQMQQGRLTATASGDVAGQWEKVLGLSDQGAAHLSGRMRLALDVPQVEAETSPTYANGVLDLTLTSSDVLGVGMTGGVLQARLDAGVVTVDALKADGALGRVSAAGQVALMDGASHNLTFTADILDLAKVPERWQPGAQGQLTLKGTVTGTSEAPTVAGAWSGSSLRYSDVSVLKADGTFDMTLPGADITQRTGTATIDAALIEASGQTIQQLKGKATLAGTETDLDVAAQHERAALTMRGRVSTATTGETVATPSALELTVADRVWKMNDAGPSTIRLTEQRWSLTPLTLTDGTARLTVSGSLPLTEAAASAQDAIMLDATQVAVAPFVTAFAGAARVNGLLNGQAKVTGSAEAPAVAATFAVTDGVADGVPFRSFGGTMNLVADVATVDLALDAGERGTMTAVGTVPLDTAAPGLKVTLTAALTDVGVVAPAIGYITNAKGAATADMVVSGTVAAPAINGVAKLTDVTFDVPETGVSYRKLNASLQVKESLLDVEAFSVEDQNGRPLTIRGRLDVLARDGHAEVDLRVVGDDFTILSNQFGQLGVDVDITAVGTVLAPQMVGEVRIVRGRFEVDRLLQQFAAVGGYESPTAPTRVAPVGGTQAAAAAASPQPPNVYSGAAMTIDVRLPDNVVVRGRGLQTEEGAFGLGDINLTLGGTLQVTKAQGGEASLRGDVNAVRGTYEFQGRRFQIERGSRLRFTGDDYTNPVLDITATHNVSGVEVTVRISGTAAEPTLTMSSEPTLDQADILALIVFNRPINELGDAQKINLAARAGTLAATALAGPLAASVARALDLDVFEIRAEEAGIGGPVVEVGRQVSDRLYVGFRHEFGDGGGNRVSLEYRLTEYLRVVTSLADGADLDALRRRTDTAGVDLIFVIRR